MQKKAKDQINALVEKGDNIGAQRLILDELAKEFGAAASPKTAEGTPRKTARKT